MKTKSKKKTYAFEVDDMIGFDLENNTDAGAELHRIAEARPKDSSHEEFRLLLLTPEVLRDPERPAFQMDEGHTMQEVKLSRANLKYLQRLLVGMNLDDDMPSTNYKVKEL